MTIDRKIKLTYKPNSS